MVITKIFSTQEEQAAKSKFHNIMGTFEYLGQIPWWEIDAKGWLCFQFSSWVQIVSLRIIILGKLQDRGAYWRFIANGFSRVREKGN